jgi:NADH:ubiquinone oxidoreductase subunit F (NADH-binding)/(2Fe-2S) ferredoxin/NAD-dependent dihydropyrimidine dehydrogenase PreA subunit
MEKITNLHKLDKLKGSLLQARQEDKIGISICCGTGCRASGSLEVVSALKTILDPKKLDVKLETKITGCHGFCEQGPLMVITPQKILYCGVKAEDVEEIVEQTIVRNRVIERLLYVDPATGESIAKETEIPFYKKQKRLILAANGQIDPTFIYDYIALGGYGGLAAVLSGMTREEVIKEIKKSGLRGRGGAGFPTGTKWKFCYEAEDTPKYIICNADEGDPGCFQDRSVLEGNPHCVLEGMLIGAYAVGAERGYIYVRNEYPLAINHLTSAIQQARECGLLGDNIMGSNFSFDLQIFRGGGAFVCGEETALLSSIEGLTGEPNPRPRPPYPTEKGLWDKPTLINNVKTWATVPQILKNGAEWFSKIGTGKSKGTMIFSLTGKVNNTGLVEVPMGLTLRELVFDIGGGIPGGKKIKAVQTGGPAGGCIPEELLDLPLDYERLKKAGSMMGSGGMIVMDEDTCMVDVARYFLSFTQDESCGKCTPCREGGKQMLRLLENITEGKGTVEDLGRLEEIAQGMQNGSLCALGKLAPNPVLTTLKYFRQEYLEHVEHKKCPAGVCKALIKYTIIGENCTGCGRCLRVCPSGAISGQEKEPYVIESEKCIKCGACMEVCRFEAIMVE